MKYALFVLLMAFSAVACAQQAPDDAKHAQYTGYPAPHGEKHARKKRLEQIAIGQRVQKNLRIASVRKELQYDKNRRQCQTALQVAKLCGKYAGTFYCNEKGFQPIAPDRVIKPALDSVAKYNMDRCAIDVAKRNP